MLKKRIALIAKIFFSFLLLVFAICGGWWVTQPTIPDGNLSLQEETLTSTQYRETADIALEMIHQVATDFDFPSVSIAVSVEGELVWAAALGIVDLKQNRAASLSTRYRAGSVSKSMTGIAAAKLVEAGQLDLDAPISRYVSSFPAKRWDPTLRQLGAHTGGIRHYDDIGGPSFWSENFSERHYTSVEDALSIFKDDPLLFEPDTDFEYSTHGFTLLSAALETASGQTYPDLIAELVWNPSGMIDTRLDDYTLNDPDRAVPYTAVGNHLLHTEAADPSYKWAGGGILSTPRDLVLMGGAMVTGQVVETSLLQNLFDSRPLADGSPNPQGYALGWRNDLSREFTGLDVPLSALHHGGASPGGSSYIFLVPDGGVAVAAMTNLSLRNVGPFRQAVAHIAGLFLVAEKSAE